MCYGVEQRQKLIKYAEKAKAQLQLKNVSFLHANVTEIDFSDYDHFYFYNSFFEHVEGTTKIDKTVNHSPAMFDHYNQYMRGQLSLRPPGTKIVTYHSGEDEVPRGYHVVRSEQNNLLKFWVKR
jgi:hypothetical protein